MVFWELTIDLRYNVLYSIEQILSVVKRFHDFQKEINAAMKNGDWFAISIFIDYNLQWSDKRKEN